MHFIDRIKSWYFGQNALYWKLFHNNVKSRNTPIFTCLAEQAVDQEEAWNQFENQLTLLTQGGSLIAKVWTAPGMTGHEASAFPIRISTREINPTSNGAYSHYGIGSVNNQVGQIQQFQNQITQLQLQNMQQKHDFAMERMEERLTGAEEANKNFWERIGEMALEVVSSNPEILNNCSNIITSLTGRGGKVPITVTGTRARAEEATGTRAEETGPIEMPFSEEEAEQIIYSAIELQQKLPGKNIPQFLQLVASKNPIVLNMMIAKLEELDG